MRKIIGLLLVACMIAALFSGCETVSPAVAIAEAINNIQALESMSAHGRITRINYRTVSEMTGTLHITSERLQSDNPIAKLDIVNIIGENYQIYADNDYSYSSVLGYIPRSNATNNSRAPWDILMALIQDLPEDLLADVQFAERSDKGNTANLLIPDDRFQEIYAEFLDLYIDYLFTFPLPETYETINPIVSITVAKGYITELTVNFDLLVNETYNVTEYYCELALRFDDPSQDYSVVPPEGYDFFSQNSN